MTFSATIRWETRWDSPERSPAERLADWRAQVDEEAQRCAAMEKQLAQESQQLRSACHRIICPFTSTSGDTTPSAGARTPSFPRRRSPHASRSGYLSPSRPKAATGSSTPSAPWPWPTKISPPSTPQSRYFSPPGRPKAAPGCTTPPYWQKNSSTRSSPPGSPSCGPTRKKTSQRTRSRGSPKPSPEQSTRYPSKEPPTRTSLPVWTSLPVDAPSPRWKGSKQSAELKKATRTSLPTYSTAVQQSRLHLNLSALSEMNEESDMKISLADDPPPAADDDKAVLNDDILSFQSRAASKESVVVDWTRSWLEPDGGAGACSESELGRCRARSEVYGEDLLKIAHDTVKFAESIPDAMQRNSPESALGSASTGLPLDDDVSEPEEETPPQADRDISSELMDSAIRMVAHPEEAMHPGRACAGLLLLHRVKESFEKEGLERNNGSHNIKRLFLDSIPADNVEIASIEQVYQPALFKKFLERVAESRASVEATFHGTRKEHLENILKHGLIPSLCATGAYGKGAYVATHAGMAHQYADPDVGGWRHMVVALVVVGRKANKGRGGVQTAVTSMDSLLNPSQYCFVDGSRLYVSHLIKYRVTKTMGAGLIGGGWEDPFQRQLSLASIRHGQMSNKAGIR